ncbi:MAG: tetratricopeptide repeat protein, partial [Candidatus Omnitrophica bacterium]|nr:tetratricopeptide repeat protein [Candidatus Omnitrophota bacterium]
MCKTIYKIASFILIVTVTINSTVQYAHPSQGSALRPVATGMKRDSVSPAPETAKLSSAGKSDISGLRNTGWGSDQRLLDLIRNSGIASKAVVLKAEQRNAERERTWIESRSSSELVILTTSGKFENMLEDIRPKLPQGSRITPKRRIAILSALILISVGILAMFYFVFRQPIRRTVMRLKNNIAKVITNLGYLGRARAEIRAKLEQILIGLVYPEGEESMKPLLDAFDTLLSEIDSTIGIDNLKEALHSQDLKRRRDIVKELYALIAHKGYLNNLKPKPLIRNLVSRLDGQDIFELLEEPNLPKEVRESRQSMRNTITACTPLSQMAYVILSLFGAEMKGATAPGHSFAVVDLTPRYKLFVDFSTGLVDLTDMPRYYVERDGYLMLTNYAPPSDRALQLKNRFVQDEITRDALLKLNLTNDELFYVMYSKIKITDSYGFTPQIYVNTCHVYFKLGMHDKAIAAGKKAVALDSNLAEARYRLALVYYEIGRYDEAIAELLQATRLDPGFSSNHQLLGLAYAGKRAFTKAEAAYKEAIRVHAQSAKAHYNLANMYDKQTRHNEALKEYELAVQHDPYMAKAYFQLGRSYFRMGISSKSLENWAKAVKLDPKLLDKLPEQLRLIIKPAAEKMRNFPPSSSVKSPDSAFLMPSAPESAATKASSSGTSDNALSQEE